jgi:repressor LexA
MTLSLTKKQRHLLNFIEDFIRMNGYAPSYEEMAEHFGLRSKATVYEHIQALEDKGYLRVRQGRARSLEVVSMDNIPVTPAIELPLVGLITAGEPIEAIQQPETISVPRELVRSTDNAFVLRVQGDSMVGEGILDGDYVIAERNFYPQNGDVVVALLRNEYATLKKYFRERDRIRLQPANPKYRPIYARNPQIQGIVRAILRKFA